MRNYENLDLYWIPRVEKEKLEHSMSEAIFYCTRYIEEKLNITLEYIAIFNLAYFWREKEDILKGINLFMAKDYDLLVSQFVEEDNTYEENISNEFNSMPEEDLKLKTSFSEITNSLHRQLKTERILLPGYMTMIHVSITRDIDKNQDIRFAYLNIKGQEKLLKINSMRKFDKIKTLIKGI